MGRNYLILLIFFISSCTARPKGHRYGECNVNEDCPRGKVCISNLCEPTPKEEKGPALEPPPGMVFVPGGTFVTGTSRNVGSSLEQPQATHATKPFFLDQYEVTTEQYLECVASKKCNDYDELHDSSPNEPVTWISWQDARAYCAFRGKRLPTEEEWEKGCRGTDGRLRPWGNQAPDCTTTWMEGCDRPKGCGGPSPYGACHMVGSVWEWTSTEAAPWNKKEDPGKNGARLGSTRGDGLAVIRGGSHEDGPEVMRCSVRLLVPVNLRSPIVGFRCAMDAAPVRQSGSEKP